MKHEYGVACTTGRPQVAFRETVTERGGVFVYVYAQKADGWRGQYARHNLGHVEPTGMDAESRKDTGFESVVMGGNVPPAVQKGIYEALEKGTFSWKPISGVRILYYTMARSDCHGCYRRVSGGLS